VSLLAKIYTPAPPAGYSAKLGWMKAHPPVSSDPQRTAAHVAIAWPLELLYSPTGALVGYAMPQIKNTAPLLEIFNPHRRAKRLPGFNLRYLHRTARNLAWAMAALHARGYVVGDVNESNILVTPQALVTMIDTDSFQVTTEAQHPGGNPTTFPCPVGKLEYTPQELQGKRFRDTLRLPEQDCFGLGVLIFQLLMDGSHPFRAQWLGQGEGDPPAIEERIARGWFPYAQPPRGPVAPPPRTLPLDALHPGVAYLVRRCFIDGHQRPALRPAPEEWARALDEAEQALLTCPNGHLHADHLDICPRCGARRIPLGRMPQTASGVASTSSSSPAPVRSTAQASTASGAASKANMQTTWQTLRMRSHTHSHARSRARGAGKAAAASASAPGVTPSSSTATATTLVALRSPVERAWDALHQVGARMSYSAAWFCGGWLMATLLGWLGAALLTPSTLGIAPHELLSVLMVGTVQGAWIGLLQWPVLRQRLRHAIGWAFLTALGMAAGALLNEVLGLPPAWGGLPPAWGGLPPAWGGPAALLLMGTAQALFFSAEGQAVLWFLVTALGWALAFVTALLLPIASMPIAWLPALMMSVTLGLVGGVTLPALPRLPTAVLAPRQGRWRTGVMLIAIALLMAVGVRVLTSP
jgi:hypothetical protein